MLLATCCSIFPFSACAFKNAPNSFIELDSLLFLDFSLASDALIFNSSAFSAKSACLS